MRIAWTAPRLDRRAWTRLAGGSASVLAALLLDTRFNIHGWLTRDGAIYVYGGQQMTHGVPPYASIVDPKGPLATMLSGLGAGIAQLLGRSDISTIRLLFLGSALLTVLGVYLLALQLWQSSTAAVVAATVFASFKGFAQDAIVGPDAHMPGVACTVFAMWLAARRQWAWAGAVASMALLVWQPLGVYAVAVSVAAVVCSPGRRGRALGEAAAGIAVPLLVVTIYFWSAGAFGRFVEAAIVFPLVGFHDTSETFARKLHRIGDVVVQSYGVVGAVLLWGGLVLVVVLAVARFVADRRARRPALADPLVLVVLGTLLAEAAFAVRDFHGYPRVYPFLPYAAIGVGGTCAVLLQRATRLAVRRAATVTACLAVAALVLGCAVWFAHSPQDNRRLTAERASACAVQRALVPGTPLYALGNPLPLVLLHRRNPDRYVYLGSGLDEWKIDHTAGGFLGWTTQIRASRASVIVLDVWKGSRAHEMDRWLGTHGYVRGYIGPWQVYLTPQARARLPAADLSLARRRYFWPRSAADTVLRTARCTDG